MNRKGVGFPLASRAWLVEKALPNRRSPSPPARRLTPEQEKNWPGFETAMSDMSKRYGDRQTAIQADRTQQKARPDIIEQLRDKAQFLSDRSVDRKTLADAAQPLYASLDDQQKRRFAKELLDVSRWPGS